MGTEYEDVRQTPGYHEGFNDAFSYDIEPLFDDATDNYKAGWHAGIEARDIARSIFNI